MGQNKESLEDLAHERAIWKVQHFGWALFGTILLAGLAGLFGDGPLSHAKAANGPLQVEYDRFARYQAASTLKLQLGSSTGGSLPAIWLARDFVEQIEMQQISPTPQRIRVAGDRLMYIFDVARTNETATISFNFKPHGYGKTRARLGVVDGPELQFAQFVYP